MNDDLLFPDATPSPVADGYVMPSRKCRPARAVASHVKRITALYHEATDAQREHGEGWYYRAATWCQRTANEYNITPAHVAGVVAALSPGCPWDRNLTDAEAVIRYFLGREMEEPKCVTYGANVEKAYAILTLTNAKTVAVHVERILAPRPQRSGNKTLAFFQVIMRPWRRDTVCIDRHVIRASGSKQLSITAHRYRCYVRSLKLAASQLRVPPNQLQPIIWTVQREKGKTT